MEDKNTQWCPQHGYPLPCAKCGLGQYEAGKKAGIKEAAEEMHKADVDWLLQRITHNGTDYVFKMTDKEWGEFIK